jgi:hypothetical protein
VLSTVGPVRPCLFIGAGGSFLYIGPARNRALAKYFSPGVKLPDFVTAVAKRKIGHKYGGHHKHLRKVFALRMARGEVFECWRPDCLLPGVPITPWVKWDLGHVEDPELRRVLGVRWPEHRRCNRATITHLKERAVVAVPPARRRSEDW